MSFSNNFVNPCSDCCEPERPKDCEEKKRPKCKRCGNLVHDPSFESQYSYWGANNVIFTDTDVYEGAIQARLGPGVASLYQTISLAGVCRCPLLFSFNAVANILIGVQQVNLTGILIAEITWLDEQYNPIGTGLRMVIPGDRINQTAKITFFAQTDRPPEEAAYARLVFSKGAPTVPSESEFIFIDGVLLAPMAYTDLIKNGDFEANLFGWTANPGGDTAFLSSYLESLEGAGHALTQFNGSLSQDISIRHLPAGTSFLLSFAVQGVGPVSLSVRLEWLDNNDNPIGSGLNLSIPNETLSNQQNYLSYLAVSFPSVPCTATARLIFSAVVPETSNFLRIDNVIFAPVLTQNLIANPSFENGLNYWQQSLVNLIERNDVYEGLADAGIGQIGGALWQDVELYEAEGKCYLFSTGLGFRYVEDANFGTMIMRVIWLDKFDREIGLGLSLVSNRIQSTDTNTFIEWIPYVGVTEPAPKGTAKARILFSKTDSPAFIEVDNVTFAQIV